MAAVEILIGFYISVSVPEGGRFLWPLTLGLCVFVMPWVSIARPRVVDILLFSAGTPDNYGGLKGSCVLGGKGNFPLQLEGLFLNGHYKGGCKECCLFPCKKEHRIFFERQYICKKVVKKCTYIFI